VQDRRDRPGRRADRGACHRPARALEHWSLEVRNLHNPAESSRTRPAAARDALGLVEQVGWVKAARQVGVARWTLRAAFGRWRMGEPVYQVIPGPITPGGPTARSGSGGHLTGQRGGRLDTDAERCPLVSAPWLTTGACRVRMDARAAGAWTPTSGRRPIRLTGYRASRRPRCRGAVADHTAHLVDRGGNPRELDQPPGGAHRGIGCEVAPGREGDDAAAGRRAPRR
jgi:hypothetical protein